MRRHNAVGVPVDAATCWPPDSTFPRIWKAFHIRGKIERFYCTVREMFLRPLDEGSIKSIEDLNARFHTWLESEYHRSPHRGLDGDTPLEAWIAKAQHIITIDPTVNLDDVFFHEITRKVHKDSTITVNGVLYEVPSILNRRTVKLRFDPRIPNAPLQLFCDGIEHGTARVVNTYANTNVSRSHPNRDHLEHNAGTELPHVAASLQAARFQTGGVR